MNPSQVIVLAVPVFLLLMAAEFVYGLARGRNTYSLNDTVGSLGLGILSQISAVFMRALNLGIYVFVYLQLTEAFPALRNEAFWTSWWGWLLALVFYDFCYYWKHRMGHEVAVLWAAHAVHHQSERYNLSTALRQTSSDSLFGWLFYLPMAVAGVPPVVFGVVALIDLLYQFWVHTEQVGKLGWFDRWFCSPSNHRVHHAVNERYLDRNYGGIFIFWDRLFGTFEEERDDDPCVYGTLSPLRSLDPLWANAEVYGALLSDSWHTRRWRDKLLRWIKRPAWRPADVAASHPKPALDMKTRPLYDPNTPRSVKIFGALQFIAVLAGTTAFLWNAHALPPAHAMTWLLVLATFLWTTSAMLQGRLSVAAALFIETAALSTACHLVGAVEFARVFKPLAMVMAMIWVLRFADWRDNKLLLLALLGSLAGDVFLMLPGNFIPGLVSFLVAHLFYIALFKQGQRWFASLPGLVVPLLAGAGMYAILWSHIPPALRGPVGAYVLVIGLMAAQALGRAATLRNAGTVMTGIGALFFMLSDSLLAWNKFASPLPLSQLWVLSTYYIAQGLIVGGMLRSARPAQAADAPALRTAAAS